MKRIAAALSALTVATASVPFAQAHAAALYFEKSVVKTSSEKTCLSFASDVANTQRFRNAHRSASEVAGEKDGAYVAITCVGRPNQQAVAVVMSTSESFETAKAVGRAVADRIKGIACFDTPC